MQHKFDYGQEVRVMRNVRNDGTFPGLETGAPLVRRGSVGFVTSIGTFLQDQIIYGVHFLAENRLVGCREEELLAADEDWVASKYEFRDKVTALASFSIDGEVRVAAGSRGEVLKVVRNAVSGVHYHVHFPGITVQVAEDRLAKAEEGGG